MSQFTIDYSPVTLYCFLPLSLSLSLSLSLLYHQISVSLSQLDGRGGESLLLSFAIHHTAAEVNDRNWDAQGKVYIKDIEILDYVNKGNVHIHVHVLD